MNACMHSSLWSSQVTFISDTSPHWLSPRCPGRAPSFSLLTLLPLSLSPYNHPSSWPASHSNILSGSEWRRLQMSEVMRNGGRGQAVRDGDGGMQGLGACAAACRCCACITCKRMQYEHGGLLKGPSSLTKQ